MLSHWLRIHLHQSYQQIASTLHTSKSVVHRWANRDSFEDKPRTGRPLPEQEKIDRYPYIHECDDEKI